MASAPLNAHGLSLCSFNMIGFGNGACMLNDLCGFYMLAAVQEHWVKKDEFDELALVHNYFFFAASGMKQAMVKANLKDYPFSGTNLSMVL